MLKLSCNCDGTKFEIRFTPRGLAVHCAVCGTRAGVLVDDDKNDITPKGDL